MSRNISHGRGGAGKPIDLSDKIRQSDSDRIGNISRQQSSTTTRDLVTPTIKQDVYTTGRGGSGNMVHNDPERPEIARESQDVESPPLRAEPYPHHTGRGMERERIRWSRCTRYELTHCSRWCRERIHSHARGGAEGAQAGGVDTGAHTVQGSHQGA